MAQLTREQILARKVGHGPVDLGGGDVVQVRGLNQHEAHTLNRFTDTRERDVWMIHTGMTDPALSLEDVEAWFGKDGAGAPTKVAAEIVRLSGLAPGQGKDATKSVPRRRSGRAT